MCIKVLSASEIEIVTNPTNRNILSRNILNARIQPHLNPHAQAFVSREMNYHYQNVLLNSSGYNSHYKKRELSNCGFLHYTSNSIGFLL